MNEIVKLLIFSSASVVYLFIISKILGKKQISQLEFIDYVMGISIGSIAAQMATDIDNTPYYYYLIAMTVFFFFDILVTVVGRKGSFFKRFFKGKPVTIIYEGKIQFKQLKKSKLDINDLIGLCREQGYFNLEDIRYAIFENSGNLSILPIGKEKPTVIGDFDKKYDEASLPCYLVIDGAISYSSLTELNKDVKWLEKGLNIKTKKDYKNIILASYDEKQKTFSVHYKN